MSMLAEPRRKQRIINLRAKNNAWSNDSTKFGQRMLEKMGWSTGKGLGSKEDGIVEHVIARYKNDEKGLGYEDKNDQWTKHEDDFNSLLANLSNGVNNDEKLHSGVSLELKSKKSKSRVHYHKFTRGKDLSRYSEKDLACIFGKKSLKNKEDVLEFAKEEIKCTEQVFTEKGSMEDYFKSKMSSKLGSLSKNENLTIKDNFTDYNDFAFRGFCGMSNGNECEIDKNKQDVGVTPFSFYDLASISHNSQDGNSSLENTDDNSQIKQKKKKVNKERENEASSHQDNGNSLESHKSAQFIKLKSISTECEEIERQPSKKLSKKKKVKQERENEASSYQDYGNSWESEKSAQFITIKSVSTECEGAEQQPSKKLSKKKKIKQKRENEASSYQDYGNSWESDKSAQFIKLKSISTECEGIEQQPSKKRSKKKNKVKHSTTIVSHSMEEIQVKKKKSSKKSFETIP